MKSDLMEFRVGREITVGVQVIEGTKTRVQPYKGIIIAMHKNGLSSTVTVRKMVQGVGVERCFPLHSPLCTFEPVVTAGTPKVRRAKLYYLRELQGKSARLKIKY
jgi:large subunit ribosomal protein L19